MSIIQTVNFSMFCDAFSNAGREDQFSYTAKRAIFHSLNDMVEDIELDVIAICCDFAEASRDELIAEYSIDIEVQEEMSDDEYEDVKNEAVKDFLEKNTMIVHEYDDVYVYMQF